MLAQLLREPDEQVAPDRSQDEDAVGRQPDVVELVPGRLDDGVQQAAPTTRDCHDLRPPRRQLSQHVHDRTHQPQSGDRDW